MVLLHPGPGIDGSVFLPGAQALADSHRLLVVDLPGNGRSPGGDPAEWTYAGFARAVQRLADELALEDWTLLGHSFGGFVAMAHLIEFPGSAARLIASCTDADEEPAPGAPEHDLEGLPEDVAATVQVAFEREDSVTTPEETRGVWLDLMPFFAGTPAAVPALEAAFADVIYQPEMMGERDWGELHALGALVASDIPVLALAGEHDRPTPPAAARRIAETAPRGELLIVEGAGHFPFAEAPERYWPALERWLARTA